MVALAPRMTVHAGPKPRPVPASKPPSVIRFCAVAGVAASEARASHLVDQLLALALAWVLRNPNVCSAIVGASRPEQVEENVAASGVTLEPQVLAQIDAVLGEHVERDAGLTEANAPKRRPS